MVYFLGHAVVIFAIRILYYSCLYRLYSLYFIKRIGLGRWNRRPDLLSVAKNSKCTTNERRKQIFSAIYITRKTSWRILTRKSYENKLDRSWRAHTLWGLLSLLRDIVTWLIIGHGGLISNANWLWQEPTVDQQNLKTSLARWHDEYTCKELKTCKRQKTN